MIDETNQTEEETAETAGDAPVNLTIQDLANIRNIIDVASQRGAYHTNEFTVVGETYNRLSNFLTSVMPATEVADDDADKEVGEE